MKVREDVTTSTTSESERTADFNKVVSNSSEIK